MPAPRSNAVTAFICTLLFAVPIEIASADTPAPHVRPIDTRSTWLLAFGYRASPTLAALVDHLEQSDVIVHVGQHRQEERAAGVTRFVTRAGRYRYLRVTIDASIAPDVAIPLLGHELQHAWEIAQAPWVVTSGMVAALFERIGVTRACGGSTCAETVAARLTGQTVRAELRAYRRFAPPDSLTEASAAD